MQTERLPSISEMLLQLHTPPPFALPLCIPATTAATATATTTTAATATQADTDADADADADERSAFLAHLHRFMRDRGAPIERVPTLAHHELDLFRLYAEVTARGGVERVISSKMWSQVIAALGLPPKRTDAATRLREHYIKYLFSYEQCFFRPPPSPTKQKTHRSALPSAPTATATAAATATTATTTAASSAASSSSSSSSLNSLSVPAFKPRRTHFAPRTHSHSHSHSNPHSNPHSPRSASPPSPPAKAAPPPACSSPSLLTALGTNVANVTAREAEILAFFIECASKHRS